MPFLGERAPHDPCLSLHLPCSPCCRLPSPAMGSSISTPCRTTGRWGGKGTNGDQTPPPHHGSPPLQSPASQTFPGKPGPSIPQGRPSVQLLSMVYQTLLPVTCCRIQRVLAGSSRTKGERGFQRPGWACMEPHAFEQCLVARR